MYKLIASILAASGVTYLSTRAFYKNQILEIEASNKEALIKKIWEFHDIGMENGRNLGGLEMYHKLHAEGKLTD